MFDKGSLARYKTFSKSRFPHGVFCKTDPVQKGGWEEVAGSILDHMWGGGWL